MTAVIDAIALIVAVAIATTATEDATAPPAQEQPQENAEADEEGAPAEPPDRAPGIGQPARDGLFEFVITDMETGMQRIGSEPFIETPQGQYVLIHLTVTNIGEEQQWFDAEAQKLVGASDREFSTDMTSALSETDHLYFDEINPGNMIEGTLVCDIPANTEPERIQLHDSAFSNGVTVNLTR